MTRNRMVPGTPSFGRVAILVALLVVTAPPSGPSAGLAAQTISGRLLDLNNDRPISLGLVIMFAEGGDSITSTISASTGHFTLAAREPGSYVLLAAALGYGETPAGVFELGEGSSMTIEYRLEPQPVPIDEIVVSLDRPVLEHALVRNGFVRRFQRGLGVFMTPHLIENSFARSTEALFEAVPGVRVGYGLDQGIVPRTDLEMIQVRQQDGGLCVPTMYVDGMWTPYSPGAGFTLSQIAPLGTVEAVELYRRPAEIPVEYSPRGSCAVMVVWTKTGLAAGQRPSGLRARPEEDGLLPVVAERGPPPTPGEQIRMELDRVRSEPFGLGSPWRGTYVGLNQGDIVAEDPAVGRPVAIPASVVSRLQVSRERPGYYAVVRGVLAGAAMGAGTWAGLTLLCNWSDCNDSVERPWLVAGIAGGFAGTMVYVRGPGHHWIATDVPTVGAAPGGAGLEVRIPAGR